MVPNKLNAWIVLLALTLALTEKTGVAKAHPCALPFEQHGRRALAFCFQFPEGLHTLFEAAAPD